MGGGTRGSYGDVFSIYGPFHLTSIDWNNSYHRTSVASSLVQGVYTLERDRQKNRVGSEARARLWWEFFFFTLVETLIDDEDGSIYGAVFVYNFYNFCQNNTPHVKVPRQVIAFRGTVLKRNTLWCDVKHDLRCMFNNLHEGHRSMHAVETVRNIVVKHSESGIWLAGHSLGAALVLVVRKSMNISGFHLDSYIFNPPISSIPLEQLTDCRIVKGAIRVAGSLVRAAAAIAFDHHVKEEDPNAALWIPNLYVNESDPICAEYIGYFRHQHFMSEVGASIIHKIASRSSLRSLLIGMKGTSSTSDVSTEPLHLIQSADMTVNMNKPTSKFWTAAHGLHQWWERDSALRENWKSCCIRHCLGGTGKQN